MRIRWTRWNRLSPSFSRVGNWFFFSLFLYAAFTSSRRGIHLRIGFKTRNRSAFNAKSRIAKTQHTATFFTFFFFPHFTFLRVLYSLRHLRVTHIRTYACIHRHRPVVTRFPSRQFILGFRLFVFFSILLFLIFSRFFLFNFCLFDFSFWFLTAVYKTTNKVVRTWWFLSNKAGRLICWIVNISGRWLKRRHFYNIVSTKINIWIYIYMCEIPLK